MPSDWVTLDMLCTYCGDPIDGRFKAPKSGDIIIDGCRPVEYRHTLTHRKECAMVMYARGFDTWAANKVLRKALGDD